MNYEVFKQKVIEELGGYLSEELRDCEFQEDKVQKVNQTLERLTLIKPETEYVPVMYYKEVYEWFTKNGDFEDCMKRIAEHFREGYEELERQKPILDVTQSVEWIKNNVVMNVINTARNSDLLKEVPFKTLQDLSAVYQCSDSNYKWNGITTFLITNALMEHLNLNEQTLESCARKNMRRLLPPSIKEVRTGIYLVTNSRFRFGAAIMLDTEFLKGLSDKMDDDFYILPSTIHEFYAVRATGQDTTYLMQIVREVNNSIVSDKDFLSNSLYCFDRDTKSVKLVG